MKTFISILSLSGILLLSLFILSCKKENCAGCNDRVEGNAEKGFVNAIAGVDTTYQWPADSIMLDGSKSTSTIGTIVEYKWTKLSGPEIFIVNPYEKTTLLINIEIGEYVFELKARNSNGVIGTDLIKISFTYNCNEMELQVINGRGKITKLGKIPNSFGNVYPFIGENKWIITGSSEFIQNFEIYDPLNKTWSTENLPNNYRLRGGPDILDFGNYLVFKDFPGKSFSFYDIKNNRWIRQSILEDIGVTMGCHENFIIWGGGINNYSVTHDKITLLNMQDGSENILNMTQARSGICIVGNKNKLFFAGGFRSIKQPTSYYDDDLYATDFTTRVDIYDLNTKTWKVAELSEGRAGIKAIASGDKVIFFGGYYIDSLNRAEIKSQRVDIYDLATDTWTNTTLPDPGFAYTKMYVLGSKILFMPGANVPGEPVTFSTFDLTTKTWRSISYPNEKCSIGSAAVIDQKLVILRTMDDPDYSNDISNILDIYDLSSDTWDEIELSLGYLGSIKTDGKYIYLLGGLLTKTTYQLPGTCYSCVIKKIPSCGMYQISF